MKLPLLCNIEILISHTVGFIGGSCPIAAGERLVGVYDYETDCGSLTCCSVDGHSVLFEADKVSIKEITTDTTQGTCNE